MPKDESCLHVRDPQLARSTASGAPHSYPFKPSLAPSAPFELSRVPYGTFRDAAFVDLFHVDTGFICSLLKYRHKTVPAVQDMQLEDMIILIWHCQTNKNWKAAAQLPKAPPERIIQDLGNAVTLVYWTPVGRKMSAELQRGRAFRQCS
ncbi:hypothetical protein HO173_003058 [Letharia columbiana]|uniref:Uncharacterized protein n=1 Tax=Letharia columbiana TaxID=112416 RepID=A0A8H6G124_9LECA|nr:uncharacterized protein HO173_003058 [Letharia columbiana]KAF6238553.1 hypothetical protein HO173_003058 [Letharia columbiana]